MKVEKGNCLESNELGKADIVNGIKVETNQGWSEAIIDDNCGWDKFQQAVEVLKREFGIGITQVLKDFDTAYLDFQVGNSKLTLFYNIYLGLSIHPEALKEATQMENVSAVEIAQKLFEIMSCE